jgi:hypothetical protein
MCHALYRTLVIGLAGALLFLGGCGSHEGVACDVCGQEVAPVLLFQGVPSTCGPGLQCVAAAVFLPQPGVCVRTTASTTCTGSLTDSRGTQSIECTYTPVPGDYEIRCGPK